MYNIWDPHTPYRAPPSFGNPFANEPYDGWISEELFNKHLKKPGPHSVQDLNGYNGAFNPAYPRQPGSVTNYEDLRKIIDGYDCGVRYADSLLGQVFDLLKLQGIYDETAVIITSDHGENLGELGLYSEHATADAVTCRIPMIIKWPGGKAGRDGGLRCNLDLAPTLAELLGTDSCPDWDGQSYAKALTNGGCPGRDSLVLSQQAHVCQRSALFGDWIYIRTIYDGFQLFDGEMLFNIADDPHEQHDRKAERPDLCARGAKILLDWQDAMMKKSQSDADPMWTVYRQGGPLHAPMRDLEGYLARLEESGRKEAADVLRGRY